MIDGINQAMFIINGDSISFKNRFAQLLFGENLPKSPAVEEESLEIVDFEEC